MSLFHLSACPDPPPRLLSVSCWRPGAADLLWAWPVVERLQQESLSPKLMDAQLAASAPLLTPPSAFQNNSNSSNNNKKNVAWRSRKRTSGLLRELYSHAVFCSAGARSLVGAFPCQRCFLVCGGRVFGNHLLWVLACAGPAGAGGVFVLRRSIPEGRARERLSVHSSCIHPFGRARPRFGLCAALGAVCQRVRPAGRRSGL